MKLSSGWIGWLKKFFPRSRCNAPHPNGAKVFVIWLLSRDAQMLIQKADGSDSLRIDIPKDSVLAENRRQPGADYLDGDKQGRSDQTVASPTRRSFAFLIILRFYLRGKFNLDIRSKSAGDFFQSR
jgi:hypothetical protein